MSRTQRLRGEILSFLTEVGEANTTAILDHVNRRFRWGATMNQLGNVLARDRRFIKVGFDEGTDIGGFRMRVRLVDGDGLKPPSNQESVAPASTMAGGLGGYVSLMRPKNLVLASATVPLGAYFALMDSSNAFPFLAVALHTLSVLCFTGAGNAMNDIKDAEIDATAHPQRPIPSGQVSLDGAGKFTSVLWCISVFAHIGGLLVVEPEVSVYLPTILIYILAVVLMVTYDHGPATKNKGVVGQHHHLDPRWSGDPLRCSRRWWFHRAFGVVDFRCRLFHQPRQRDGQGLHGHGGRHRQPSNASDDLREREGAHGCVRVAHGGIGLPLHAVLERPVCLRTVGVANSRHPCAHHPQRTVVQRSRCAGCRPYSTGHASGLGQFYRRCAVVIKRVP